MNTAALENGAISGVGELFKFGPGTVILGGTNTYTGPTTISSGTLGFKNRVSFYSGDDSKWIAPNFIVQPNASALFFVGGAGEFTAADMVAIANLGGIGEGFQPGSSLVLDTSNATGGEFALSHFPLGNVNGLHLVKSGGGTLALGVEHNFTGGVTIDRARSLVSSFPQLYPGPATPSRLRLDHTDALGTSGTINFAGGMLQFSAANTRDYSARFNQTGLQFYYLDTNGQNVHLGTALNNPDGELIKAGAGTLTFSGNNPLHAMRVYGGHITVGTGVTLGTSNAGLELTNGNLLIDGGTLSTDRTVIGSDGNSSALYALDNAGGKQYLGPLAGRSATATMNSGTWNAQLRIGADGSDGVAPTMATVTINGGVFNGAVALGGGFNGQGGAHTSNQGTLFFNGGTLNTSRVDIGWTGRGSLLMTGGTWNHTGVEPPDFISDSSLHIGESGGNGTLLLTGGTATTTGAHIGYRSTGAVNVSNNGNWTVGKLKLSSDFQNNSIATLRIQGGTTQINQIESRAGGAGSSATIEVSNGALNVNSMLMTGNTFLSITGGTLTTAQMTALHAFANVSGGVWNASVEVAVGNSGGAGAGNLTVNGGALNAPNVTGYKGSISVSGGALAVSNTLGIGGLSAPQNVRLSVSGGTVTAPNVFVGQFGEAVVSGGSLSAGSGLTVDGELAISDAGVVNVGNGTGTLSLRPTGRLNIGGEDGQPAIAPGTLNAAGVHNEFTNDAAVVDFHHTGELAFAPQISGWISVYKTGSGTTNLTGANSHAAETAVFEGTLGIGHDQALGTAPLRMSGGGIRAVGMSRAVSNPVTVTASFNLGRATHFTGDVTLLANAVITSTNPDSGAPSVSSFSGVISGAGRILNFQAGPNEIGTILLSGANTYSGGTDILGGTIAVGHDQALGTGRIIIAGGGVRASGGSRTLSNSLILDGSFALGRATHFTGDVTLTNSVTITSANPGADTPTTSSFAGTISGAHALTFAAGANPTGAIVLSGTNTYSGGTNLIGGVLSIHADGALGSGALKLDGGALRNTASMMMNRPVTLGPAGGTFEANGGFLTLNSPIDGTGGLTKKGPAILTLPGAQTFSGPTTIEAGMLKLASGSLASPSVTISAGALFLFNGNGNTAANISGAGAFTHEGNGTTVLTGAATHTGGTTITGGGTLQIGNGASAGSLSGNVASDGMLTFNRAGTLSYGGAISGTGALTKSGTGTLTLSGASSSYTGVTVFAGGVVDVATFGNYGQNSSLGARSAGQEGGGNIGLLFRGGTLRYSGATAQSTNRAIRVSTNGGGTIDASGSNPSATLSFTAGSPPDFWENPGTRMFQLTGTNTGANTFGMAVTDLPGTTVTNLVKSGPGTWVLTNANNNHLGTTTVLDGMLVVNGSITGSATTVQSGATLSGSGSVAALTVSSGGNLAPGNSPGTLNTGTFDLQSGAHLKLELGGLAANQSDRVNVTGSVNLAGDLQISLFGGFVPQVGDRFFAIINDGSDSIAGTFSNDDVLQRITIDGATFQLNYADNFGGAGLGNDLSLTMVAVPEPASAALLLLGGLGLIARRRRL